MAMEMSTIKDSKNDGGIIEMTEKKDALLRWSLTRNLAGFHSFAIRGRSGESVSDYSDRDEAQVNKKDKKHNFSTVLVKRYKHRGLKSKAGMGSPELIYQRALAISNMGGGINLGLLPSYPVSPYPSIFFKPDGSRRTNTKSDLLHALKKEIEHFISKEKPQGDSSIVIIEEMAVLQSMNTNGLRTFDDVAMKVMEHIAHHLITSDEVHRVFDRYDIVTHHPKQDEQARRYGVEIQVYDIKDGPPLPEFKKVLANNTSESALTELFWKRLIVASGFEPREYGAVISTSPIIKRLDLHCNHIKADTRLISHAFVVSSLAKNVDNVHIYIESLDTDVFLVSIAHYCLRFKTGKIDRLADKRYFIPVHMLANRIVGKISRALIPEHSITGCDTVVSSIAGFGKKTINKVLKNMSDGGMRSLSGMTDLPFQNALESAMLCMADLFDPKEKSKACRSSIDSLRYHLTFKKNLPIARWPPLKNSWLLGNKAELILRLEEANPDRSWIREFCQTNNPLLRDALEESRRLNEEKQEMARKIAELQRQLTEMAQNRQGINSNENKQIRIAEIGDGGGGVDGADTGIANEDDMVEKSTILENFGKGRSTFNMFGDDFLVNSDDAYYEKPQDVNQLHFEPVIDRVAPGSVGAPKRKRFEDMIAALTKKTEEKRSRKMINASNEKVVNKKCASGSAGSTKSGSLNELSDLNQLIPPVRKPFKMDSRNLTYVRRVIKIRCLYKSHLSDDFTVKGLPTTVELNGNKDFSIESLKIIFQRRFIQEGSLTRDEIGPEGYIIQVGLLNGSPIEYYTDEKGNQCDLWTFSKGLRDKRHVLRLALLVTKIAESPVQNEAEPDTKHNYELTNCTSKEKDVIEIHSQSGDESSRKKDSASSFEFPDFNDKFENFNSGGSSGSCSNKMNSTPTSSHLKSPDFQDWSQSNDDMDKENYPIYNEEHNESYKRETKLGGGAQGIVMEGSFRMSTVAIKTMFRGDLDEYSKREMTLLMNIRHSNVIQMMAWCRTKTQIHIVMEYSEGDNLWTVITREDKRRSYSFSSVLVKNFASFQIALAMAFCHLQKPDPVVHRDLKPGNIMINKALQVKVCDFGFAKCKSFSQSLKSSCRGNIYGTYSYMPPEVILDHGNGSTEGDVWSFGCTLVEIYNEGYIWGQRGNKHELTLKNLRVRQVPKFIKVPGFLSEMLTQSFGYMPPSRPTMRAFVELFEENRDTMVSSAHINFKI
ncbi:hypothetical protein QAD02_020348 [Eretmocerus hayati]|uniref:Uncharacterized protein n=1 Tax=Eretmocerus hayati TaxID=131215 RepID=A0ACC2PNG6_9HYME|nr:hypothetical protein QAD02_020348 [Eretmocerus hayati]